MSAYAVPAVIHDRKARRDAYNAALTLADLMRGGYPLANWSIGHGVDRETTPILDGLADNAEDVRWYADLWGTHVTPVPGRPFVETVTQLRDIHVRIWAPAKDGGPRDAD